VPGEGWGGLDLAFGRLEDRGIARARPGCVPGFGCGGSVVELTAGGVAFGGEGGDPIRGLVVAGAGVKVELAGLVFGDGGFGGAERVDGLGGVAAA